jgi:predicted GTPase
MAAPRRSQHEPAGLKNRMPKLNYMVQEDDIDMPSFKIFGAHTKFLHWSYKRYLEKQFRQTWPLNDPARFTKNINKRPAKVLVYRKT